MTLSTISVSATNKKHGSAYGIIDVKDFLNSFDYFRFALACEAITSKYVQFHIRPRKKKSDKSFMFVYYNVSAKWKCYHDCSFAEWLNEYIGAYGYDDEEVKYTGESTSLELLEANIKKEFSFFVHINDIIALHEYIYSIIKTYNLLGKSEAYLEFDLENNRIVVNKEFEAKIFKVKIYN